MEQVPAYVTAVFMITAFATAGIFLYTVRSIKTLPAFGRLLFFLVPFWMAVQFFLARTGFYLKTEVVPPRIFLFAMLPPLLLILLLFLFGRESLVAKLPLAGLALIHIVRIPVEFTLHWLYEAGAVPSIMTFHGTNLDILSGLTAPLALYFAVKGMRTALLAWNVTALGFVLNVVITAILCVPTPLQRLAFDQPNVAVLHSPFIWLPAIIVPTVFFAHFASLYILLRKEAA